MERKTDQIVSDTAKQFASRIRILILQILVNMCWSPKKQRILKNWIKQKAGVKTSMLVNCNRNLLNFRIKLIRIEN